MSGGSESRPGSAGGAVRAGAGGAVRAGAGGAVRPTRASSAPHLRLLGHGVGRR
ncbi:hypothetical protein FRIG_14360 [Frigoribacterium faeni]|uniref:hypothetical protein n=1 Tax=Frigoribacterium faeni TaxID=145483 RepID=UPI001FACD18F|nr:hypothetical protein [Frigoribacterium faeni]MCJ0702300.1 hypothetical protein [Frigoribacterium faeni]